jgi:hypothetical protein
MPRLQEEMKPRGNEYMQTRLTTVGPPSPPRVHPTPINSFATVMPKAPETLHRLENAASDFPRSRSLIVALFSPARKANSS